jgi:hypothetical protein
MRTLLLLCFFLAPFFLAAQEQQTDIQDSVIVETRDTGAIKSYAARYNPRKALLYAAILPGLGQIYNKKYWKLPLVYGGMFATGYAINFYNDLYKDYRHMLFLSLEQGTPENEICTACGARTTVRGYRLAVDKARRERDFMMIIMGAVYILQIVDAHVDAHLKEFDLNPKLQVSVEPMMEQNSLIGRQTGASIVLRF